MEHDAGTPQYMTSDKTSFASVSARDRWPVILTGAIDDVHRSISPSHPPAKQEEGKAIIKELVSLKYELQHDRRLTPIPDNEHPSPGDIERYNDELKALRSPTWLNVPWLYSECYLYRRLHASFASRQHWKSYDVFARQKMATFRSSRPAVLELAARYRHLLTQIRADDAGRNKAGSGGDDEAQRLLFREMCEICLWGNATDLSLLTSLAYDDIQKLQGSEARKASEQNILVNDFGAAYETLLEARTRKGGRNGADGERRVDIVLDNAGFELYVDLILAGYLLASGLATHVVLHPKSIPWFVSDVLPADFAALLGALADPRTFFETQSEDEQVQDKTPAPLPDADADNLAFLFRDLSALHADGRLILRPNRFWTLPGSFWRLPAEDKALLDDLRTSELVVFKGDLNYRKLTCDAAWDPTTPFGEAIGPLGPGSGLNVLALRTCKADVVVGLQPGVDERLRAAEGGGGDSGQRRWAWTGKWAVVSFSAGR